MKSETELLAGIHRFTALRVDPDKGRGRAPHKPLLILAVLDLLESGQITDGWVSLSPDLVVRFQNLWPIVYARRQNQGDIRLPFHALSGDRVWAVFEEDGRPSRSRETSVRARIADDLFAALGDSAFRAQLRRLLVATYFPPAEQVSLAVALGFESALDSTEIAAFAKDRAAYRVAREGGRSAKFKTDVVISYHHTCALTGYRLTTTGKAGIVEAAHIHQHAKSRNNDPENGLALTPTAHALFDMGLWSVDEELRILVKPATCFTEEGPSGGFSLHALAGHSLNLPTLSKLRPHRDHLHWHRLEHGFSMAT